MNRREQSLLFGIPLFVLAASFAVFCVRHGTAWPWGVIAHEDGVRTLLGAIFFFEHALGELPEEMVLAIACAGAALQFFKAAPSPSLVRWRRAAGTLAISFDLFILIGALATAGWAGSGSWLLQYHTRPGVALEFGSHWRYHLLSQMTLMLWAALLIRAVVVSRHFAGTVGPSRLWSWSWIVLAICTAVFGINAAPFRDPRYLGHQARETFTHALVTIPLAVGVCLTMTPTPAALERRPGASFWRAAALIALACGILAAYQLLGVLLTGSQQHAQTRDLTRLVCGHFFEHTFSYLVVPAHAAWFFLMASGRKAAS